MPNNWIRQLSFLRTLRNNKLQELLQIPNPSHDVREAIDELRILIAEEEPANELEDRDA